jgi:hypothetical protein
VRTFGDSRPANDTVPRRGRSSLAPALAAAAATDRPVIVVTDGELDDVPVIAPDLLARAQVEVLPRPAARDVAVVDIDGPSRVTSGDSIRVAFTVRTAGARPGDSSIVELRSDDSKQALLARRVVRGDEARGVLRAASSGLGAGEHLLSVRVANAGDAEPRTDERLLHLTVTETPGVVLVASPADWDTRFLYRTIHDVAALPVRGYVRIGDTWRTMGDLKPVTEDALQKAIHRADLLVLKGDAVSRADAVRTRGVWLWPGASAAATTDGDWYLTAAPASPLAVALGGLPVDSFPPVVQLASTQPPPIAWVGLMAQAGRRGAPRPAFFGLESQGTRRVVTAVTGLWRWSFRGGSSEQGYRALIGATVTWLLGAPDSARGVARPVRPVVMNGREVIFEWTGAGPARVVPMTWSGTEVRADTLRFDGAGHAEVWLPPGAWHYRLEGGGEGLVAVEQYSTELLPHQPTLASKPGRSTSGAARTAARDWIWLFAVAVLALCAEWLLRRKLGLR